MRAARARPGTPFNLNHADPDGRDLAVRLRELLLGAGWSQLSAVSPAPGFVRQGLIVWTPPGDMAFAETIAAALRDCFPVEVIARTDGGPVALTVGRATWAAARGVRPA